jgi:hypothetical protein
VAKTRKEKGRGEGTCTIANSTTHTHTSPLGFDHRIKSLPQDLPVAQKLLFLLLQRDPSLLSSFVWFGFGFVRLLSASSVFIHKKRKE